MLFLHSSPLEHKSLIKLSRKKRLTDNVLQSLEMLTLDDLHYFYLEHPESLSEVLQTRKKYFSSLGTMQNMFCMYTCSNAHFHSSVLTFALIPPEKQGSYKSSQSTNLKIHP